MDLISGVVQDGTDVPKAGFRGFINARMPHRMADPDELRSLDLSAVLTVIIGAVLYARDTSDTTSTDDGSLVIVDAGGARWHRQAVVVSGFTFRGAYSSETTYSAGDVVTEQGAAWAYHGASPGEGNAPPTLPATVNGYWQRISGASTADVLGALGVNSITISTDPPSGGAENDIWLQV